MTVYLVGAGPGDPGLMTRRSLELIAAADVIVYDRLIPDGALDGARPDAELIFVGKEGGGEQVPQAQTDRLLLEHGARAGIVVRLKGGDPFVFGRGGEEAELLRAAGIEFEIVPGVTAGIAAPAYAGIPVTHRDLASSVAFLTGHEDPAKTESAHDWDALAAFPGTLCVYMGVRQLEGIAARLIRGGRDPDEPAALVQRGTFPTQRTVRATLGTLAVVAREQRIGAPAIAVFGPVAQMREQIAWFERRPLHGRTVAVTRARAQASGLAVRLAALGARVIEAPTIRIVELPGPVPDLTGVDLIVFSSANGVGAFFGRLAAAAVDARALAGLRVAAMGPGTARALAERGVRADIIPDRFIAEGMVEALSALTIARALIVGGREGRDVLADALTARGVAVEVAVVYENVVDPLTPETLTALAGADYLTFTSASSARNYLDAGGPVAGRRVSIGPATSAALTERGVSVDVEATPHDLDGLIGALVADAQS
ncbi:uroporphyrinogen-III C-methyltransferase [Conexibacter sp. DBS9H8]|uniref:uroporphyrinogen-III C-methyltransferase n=1 Tax=Conexibacter sp. DBS9H8 TaxID=2937801 RepID=UPI00200CFF0C|nr:uroporphyrinogen-III C-methyltransferase [Conexibacter sp. DBS9H8]